MHALVTIPALVSVCQHMQQQLSKIMLQPGG